MSIINSTDKNIAICKALDLNPSVVQEITILVRAGKMLDINVKLLPTSDQIDGLISVLKNKNEPE